MRIPRSFVVLCACLLLAGCESRTYEGEQRFPITGKVTVDGQPVDIGTISFLPTNSERRVSGGPIQDGVYSVTEEMGPNAGAHRIEIHWHKKTGAKYRDNDSGEMYDTRKEGLPAKFHSQSELTAEVSPEKTTFDFDLKVE
jgi:hypothetical protein